MSDPLYIPARLGPADAMRVLAEDLPVIPDWWPVPGVGGVSDDIDSRRTVRRARQLSEACQGPEDTRRGEVRREPDGAPPQLLRFHDNLFTYRLDEKATTKERAVYRYSPPESPGHRAAMRAVEEGFGEYGKRYTEEATHDDTTAVGYDKR
ncbi:MAG: hypothetical protein ACRCZP_10795 [Phycicoccus sp.]